MKILDLLNLMILLQGHTGIACTHKDKTKYILRGKNKNTGNYFFYLSLDFYICTLIVDIS